MQLQYRCWQYLVLSIFQGIESKQRKRRWSWQRSPTSKERRHTAQMNHSLILQEHQQKTHECGMSAFIIPTRRRQEAAVPPKGCFVCREQKKKQDNLTDGCATQTKPAPPLSSEAKISWPVIAPCEMKSENSLRYSSGPPTHTEKMEGTSPSLTELHTECLPFASGTPSFTRRPFHNPPPGRQTPSFPTTWTAAAAMRRKRARFTQLPNPGTQIRAHSMNTFPDKHARSRPGSRSSRPPPRQTGTPV